MQQNQFFGSSKNNLFAMKTTLYGIILAIILWKLI